MAGSPAIDAADPTAFPPTDQRGYPRPFGLGPDIGAFEYSISTLSLSYISAGAINLGYDGTNGQTFRIQSSFDLAHWISIATNTIGTAGYLTIPFPATYPAQFFRAVSP